MDPNNLLDVPSFAGTGRPQKSAEEKGFGWGHQVEYKSLFLDTLPDNRAPLTSTRRFKNDDNRNMLTRYDDVQGTRPNPLPYCRGQWTGYHDTALFPKEPYVKPEVEKAWCRPGPTKPPRVVGTLTTKDIEGASSAPALVQRGNRHTDPVQPVYQLPQFIPVEAPEVKFIRDSIECKDITRDMTRKLFVNAPRESTSLKVSDISGTSSKRLHRERQGLYSPGNGVPALPTDQLYVKDIAHETKKLPYHMQETNRHTDPLDPHYRYNVPSETWLNSRLSGEVPKPVTQKYKDDWYIGPVSDQQCRRYITGAPLKSTPGLNGDITYREYMLRTEDVDGARAGTAGRLGKNRTTPFYRTQAGRTNWLGDMDGAAPKGAFTLLPGHIIQKRLAGQTQASAAPGQPPTAQPQNSIQGGAGQTSTPRGLGAGSARASPRHATATPRGGALGGHAPGASMAGTPRGGAGGSAKQSDAGTPRLRAGSGQATPQRAAAALNKQLLAALSG